MDVIDLVGKEVLMRRLQAMDLVLHPLSARDEPSDIWRNHDLLTVGETWGATPEIAKMYSDPDT